MRAFGTPVAAASHALHTWCKRPIDSPASRFTAQLQQLHRHQLLRVGDFEPLARPAWQLIVDPCLAQNDERELRQRCEQRQGRIAMVDGANELEMPAVVLLAIVSSQTACNFVLGDVRDVGM